MDLDPVTRRIVFTTQDLRVAFNIPKEATRQICILEANRRKVEATRQKGIPLLSTAPRPIMAIMAIMAEATRQKETPRLSAVQRLNMAEAARSKGMPHLTAAQGLITEEMVMAAPFSHRGKIMAMPACNHALEEVIYSSLDAQSHLPKMRNCSLLSTP